MGMLWTNQGQVKLLCVCNTIVIGAVLMSSQTAHTLAVDFGTSNTAIGMLDGGAPRLLHAEPGNDTLPTTVFLDFNARGYVYGTPAIDALIGGEEGRFMRALKSVLGSPLMREERQFMNERKRLLDIIAGYLAELKRRAEAEAGVQFDHVLSGRPVHFRGAGADRDAKAEADLRECYELAGFSDVGFMTEPEAAARAALDAGDGKGAGLVVDIGGGTSDFSVFRYDGPEVEILSTHGLKIGGTDFDRLLSLAHVMPRFGMGSMVRNLLGPGEHAMPNAIYVGLATWERIPFVYSPAALREVRDLRKLARAPEKLDLLEAVLEHELGHDVAFAVEAAKIQANGSGQGAADLGEVKSGLAVPISGSDLMIDLAELTGELTVAALQVVKDAGLTPAEIDRVIYVGGSSLMGVVRDPITAAFPAAKHEVRAAFTAIIAGLTRSLAGA